MSDNPAATYARALAALAAARDGVESEFSAAKAARQSDPTDDAAKARYAAARDSLLAMRAIDREGRDGVAVGGDAVASVEG